jgi:hypothetical protein
MKDTASPTERQRENKMAALPLWDERRTRGSTQFAKRIKPFGTL